MLVFADDPQWCCDVDGRDNSCLGNNAVYQGNLVCMDIADDKSGICRAGEEYNRADDADVYRGDGC